MRIERRFLNWGIFFILLGAVPLAVEQGLVTRETVEGSFRLWPLVLIGLGVGVLLRRTPAAFAGGLIVASTFGLIAGSALAVGTRFPGIGCVDGGGSPFETRQGTFAGGPASVRIELDCGELTVGVASGTAWSVSGTDQGGRGPQVDGTSDRLAVQSRDGARFFPFDGGAGGHWTVSLPRDVSLGLFASVNAGSGRLDLDGARLDEVRTEVNAGEVTMDLTGASASSVRVSVNAGSAKLTLPNASLTGRLETNAGSIKFCAPPGVGLRLVAGDVNLGSVNFGQRGLVESGDVWQTTDYASAAVKIDLTTNVNAGSIELNPEEGCQ